MTFSTHGFRVSVVSDVRERVRDIRSPLRFVLRKSSLVECVSVLHGTCLQCVEFFYIRQYVQPCLSNNPKYTFYTIKSSPTLTQYVSFWSCSQNNAPIFTKSKQALTRQKRVRKRVKHRKRCKIVKYVTSLVRYDLNLTLGCHILYYLAPLPVLDPIYLYIMKHIFVNK